MGSSKSSRSSDGNVEKSSRGCCPCFCKTDCKGRFATVELEFHVEGSIPEDVDAVPCVVKAGGRLVQSQIVRTGDGKLKCALTVPTPRK